MSQTHDWRIFFSGNFTYYYHHLISNPCWKARTIFDSTDLQAEINGFPYHINNRTSSLRHREMKLLPGNSSDKIADSGRSVGTHSSFLKSILFAHCVHRSNFWMNILLTNFWITSVCPAWAAVCSGVALSLSSTLTEAPPSFKRT